MEERSRLAIVRQLLGIANASGGYELEALMPTLASRISASGLQIGSTGDVNQLLPVFNVQFYGAKGDANNDDTSAIQAAITAAVAAGVGAGADGAIVYLPTGYYNITSTLTVPTGVTLLGAGMRSTQIRVLADVTAVILGGAASSFSSGVADLTIAYSPNATSAQAVVFDRVFRAYVRNVRTTGAFNAVAFGTVANPDSCAGCWIDACRFETVNVSGAHGMLIYGGGATCVTSTNFARDVNATSLATASILTITGGSSQVDTWFFRDVQSDGHDIGIKLVKSSGDIFNIFISHLTVDVHKDAGIVLNSSGTATIQNVIIDGVWIQGTGSAGVGTSWGIELDQSAGTIKRVTISNSEVFSCRKQGLRFSGTCAQVIVSGNIIHDNSQESVGSTPGVSVFDAMTDFVFSGNVLSGANHSYGLRIQNAASDRFVVTGNLCTGNATGGILNAAGVSSSKVVRGNPGYVTETSGTGTINSGATSATITHGLAVTPAAKDITVNFTESPTADPGNFWISAVGATTFVLNVRNDPGASNLDFTWQAAVY